MKRESVRLSERVLWRLLYESAAHAGGILALDVEDLDLPNHHARIRSKGGDLELVFFQTASRVLPRLLAARTRGPVFVTGRAATAGTPTLDVCPATGHARLSYRRAAAPFTQHTGGLTLRQLRHSSLTHLAESGESTVLLMGKSRQKSLRSLPRPPRLQTQPSSTGAGFHIAARSGREIATESCSNTAPLRVAGSTESVIRHAGGPGI